MISERFERLLDGLVAAMREDQGCGIKVELIDSNMRNEVKVLKSAEEAAFRLWLSEQYTKRYTKINWEELPNI